MNNVNILEGIKAISFDGDGTLWDFEKVMHNSLQCVIEEFNRLDPSAASRLSVETMIKTRNQVASELKGKVINLEAIRLEAFKRTLNEIDRPDNELAAYLNQVYLKHRFEDIELFDDVMPALNSLRKRYKLGLLSNGNSYPDRCGLDGIFSFVVFSQDYGFEKPDDRLFQVALDKAGCSKEELLHVGDSLVNDVVGAMQTGLRSVWLNRHNMVDEQGIGGYIEIHDLRDLLGMLSL